jgi:protoheme IX farnesyltransferase
MISAAVKHPTNSFRDYLELCKPRVVLLMILTSLVGMCLAPHDGVPYMALVFGNLGIGGRCCRCDESYCRPTL